jgi:antitoxin MazE
MKVQIGKWGNSLAVRLPREIVDKFHLKEGDVIDADALERALRAASMSREQAVARIRELRRPLPADWTFDREEANAR